MVGRGGNEITYHYTKFKSKAEYLLPDIKSIDKGSSPLALAVSITEYSTALFLAPLTD